MSKFHTAGRAPSRPWWRQVDYRVIAAFTGLLLVIALVAGLFQALNVAENSNREKDQLIGSLADSQDSLDDLNKELRRVSLSARQERREGRVERRRLLRQQTIMISLLRNAGVIAPQATPGDMILINPQPRGPKAPSTAQVPSTPRPPGSGGQPSAPSAPDAPRPTTPPRGLLETVVGGVLDLPCTLLRLGC